jgi:hypothetical protein
MLFLICDWNCQNQIKKLCVVLSSWRGLRSTFLLAPLHIMCVTHHRIGAAHTIKVCVWSSAWINTRSRRESEFQWAMREKTMRECVLCTPFTLSLSLRRTFARPAAANTAAEMGPPAHLLQHPLRAQQKHLGDLFARCYMAQLKYLLLKSPSRALSIYHERGDCVSCLNASGIISGQFITARACLICTPLCAASNLFTRRIFPINPGLLSHFYFPMTNCYKFTLLSPALRCCCA